MPCRVAITLSDGRRFEIDKQDYEGVHTRPMSWESVFAKCHQLAPPFVPAGLLDMIANAILELPNIRVKELTALLGQISRTESWRVSI
jgi:2-methylcitrate dehydratase